MKFCWWKKNQQKKINSFVDKILVRKKNQQKKSNSLINKKFSVKNVN